MPGADHTIYFGPKFTQATFDETIWEKAADGVLRADHYSESFSATTQFVVFDLSVMEWIGTEQIVFLFAWIRNIKLIGKRIKVRLPYRNHLAETGYYKANQLEYLKQRYVEDGRGYVENEQRIKRRRTRNIYLLSIWRMRTHLGLDSSDFDNIADFGTVNREEKVALQNALQIIPFTFFDIGFDQRHIKYDTYFNDIFNKEKGSYPIFDLQKDMQDLLKRYASYLPFESKILSNVITQELFINSLQHSFEQNKRDLLPECYVTAFLSNQWPNPESRHFVPSFSQEKYPETLDFYKDKDAIRKEMSQLLRSPKHRHSPSRVPSLQSYPLYRNISYLEFAFLDLGDGIAGSLRPMFREASRAADFRERHLFSEGFDAANEDCQILEYAFQLETSKNPLDKTIAYYDLVPRGLFFLVDMVRRYKGLMMVRSGHGKIVFDFSDQLVIRNTGTYPVAILEPRMRIREAITHVSVEHEFPGTMTTIILPERRTEELSRRPGDSGSVDDRAVIPAVRQELPVLADYAYAIRADDVLRQEKAVEVFVHNQFHYVSILFIYNEIVEELRRSQSEINIHHVYDRLFCEVNRRLDAYRESPCIIFFDFGGLSSGNAPWIKIIYYLFLTPKINEITKAIIVNLPPDEGDIIRDLKRNYFQLDRDGETVRQRFPEPYLYRPIPCLNFKIDAEKEEDMINWIGLKNEQHADLFSSLLLGGNALNIELHGLQDKGEGNLLVKNAGWLTAVCSGIQEIAETFFEVRKAAIVGLLKGFIQEDIDPVSGKPREIFQVSNNAYQSSYLTLYEPMHDKFIARYFGRCLLDKYCSYVAREVARGQAISNFKLDKIIAVTVSSQLIGVAIRDLIEEDESYRFLRNDHVAPGSLDRSPDLIMLSSYYSFDTEKPFDRIELLDKLLIVNDVISTGKLVEKLIDKIENGKNAIINAIFSIADTRVPAEAYLPDEAESVDFDDYEVLCFTLANYADGIRLHKFKGPYQENRQHPVVIKRINPLLNTIVELKSIHSEQDKILFREPADLIVEAGVDPKYFKIGHFHQNLTHIGYLTAMRPLFGSTDGLDIISKIRDVIASGKHRGDGTNRTDGHALAFLDLEAARDELRDLLPADASALYLAQLEAAITGLREVSLNQQAGAQPDRAGQFDFIFYPVFSGIEKIRHFKLGKIFGVHPDNVIGLQRFDTPKGWRFPFPAKRHNQTTKNKKVLILDSGSLTGESLVQLIDNVAFLDVASITVISIITRIEDFYREFYSRLRAIKVKRLKNKMVFQGTLREKTVTIEVLFGINLHIPVYQPTSCPFCAEIEYLDDIALKHIQGPSDAVKKYIILRKQELTLLHASKDELVDTPYLPKLPSTGAVDSRHLFITRDIIGKIDSYRFYPEYFQAFDETIKTIARDQDWAKNGQVQRDIENLLACILHESYLFELINSLMNELMPALKAYLFHLIEGPAQFQPLYNWAPKSVVMLMFTLNFREIFELPVLEKIIRYADKDAFLFLQYKFWDLLYSKTVSLTIKTQVEELLLSADAALKGEQGLGPDAAEGLKEIMSTLTDYYNFKDLADSDNLLAPFYNLKKFVLNGKYRARHFLLKEYLNKLIYTLTSTQPSLTDIRAELENVLTIFKQDIKPNVKLIRDIHLKKYYQIIYNLLGDEKPGILYYLNELEKINQALIKNGQQPIHLVEKELKHARAICVELVTIVLVEDEATNTFFRICQQYPCDFQQVLNDMVSKRAYAKLVVINDQNVENRNMAINTTIFKGIFEEIFNNAERICDMSDLKLVIRCHITDNGIFINIEQNKAFRERRAEGGLYNNVRHFVHKFGGGYDDNDAVSFAQQKPFIIDITLHHHEYKS
ncbi:hypothetical protein LX99_00184 [Mucilaginibacter oryzae]|uniref:Uncharacterized protein n=1 Tax=Mucilaginibacter oryzae TaxID=468058 RepID=A0A316HEV8_9SPHI|nr:hypothetical protein [Mucilaginibacter oryzae]PWK79724.1 hypothetical protein LX99_00184 [Mucilaginibacter oryzae]